MADFIRARSTEQKAQRMAEIKSAAKRQFDERPYHEITLTTIAEELGWSRASLYKYVNTKEEIFLSLDTDECAAYFDALLAALPEGCGLSHETIAEVWAGIANAHQDYFRLGEILAAIIETNVTVDALADFKGAYYTCRDALSERLESVASIERSKGNLLIEAVYFHAVGAVGTCRRNPLIAQALEQLGRVDNHAEFREEMRDFITMCLGHYRS